MSTIASTNLPGVESRIPPAGNAKGAGDLKLWTWEMADVVELLRTARQTWDEPRLSQWDVRWMSC